MPLPPRRALQRLSDRQLHALLARVQTALFDRAPTTPDTSDTLVVEIVDPTEARLLTLYRALPRTRRPHALAALTALWARGTVPPRPLILTPARARPSVAKSPPRAPQPQPAPWHA